MQEKLEALKTHINKPSKNKGIIGQKLSSQLTEQGSIMAQIILLDSMRKFANIRNKGLLPILSIINPTMGCPNPGKKTIDINYPDLVLLMPNRFYKI